MKVNRDNLEEELANSLLTSLYDLVDDAKRYDNGDINAIKRSAITLRSLLYDKPYSHSLLNQMGLDRNVQFASFAKSYDDYSTAISFNRLLFTRFKIKNSLLIKHPFYDTFMFYPDHEQPYDFLSFNDWWNQDLITFRNDDSSVDNSITRKDLILAEANQDGPAHFDQRINKIYKGYRDGLTGFIAGKDGHKINPVLHKFYIGGYDIDKNTIQEATRPTGITLSLTRQVVHEVLISLNQHGRYRLTYNPDFDKMFKAKLNYMGWRMFVLKK